MKLLFLLAAVVACGAINTDLDEHWQLFKKSYSKVYSEAEEKNRREIWEENVKRIQKHNMLYDMGLKTYTVGLNKYMDLSDDEYRTQLLGFNLTAMPGQPNCGQTYTPPSEVLPDTVDWRPKGFVTPVKDQKACGSCWAFSATGSLEGQHFKKTGQLVSLSEQNLVDCAQKEGNHGCGGGFMQAAFKYVKDNGGIDTEASYPYTAKDQKCAYSSKNLGATDTGCYDIMKGSEQGLRAAVAFVGPVAVAIDAAGFGFRGYKTGVYNELFCSQDRLDHGVLAVGYGSQDGMDYWIIKNSWGLSYGNKGYILMRRNEYNQCGIASSASFPTV